MEKKNVSFAKIRVFGWGHFYVCCLKKVSWRVSIFNYVFLLNQKYIRGHGFKILKAHAYPAETLELWNDKS